MSDTARDSIRVLHVDDNPDFVELAATFIERENEDITVHTETNPRNALSMLDGGAFDCVVSDYAMPEMDGLAFLGRVRESYPDLPFILFTGEETDDLVSEAVAAGATGFVRKKTGADQYALLELQIRNAVDKVRTETELDTCNERRTALINNLPGTVYRCRNEVGWPMEFIGDQCADLTGYSPEEFESGDVLFGRDVVHPDDQNASSARIQRALEAGEQFDASYRIQTKDGTLKWVREQGRGIRDADGRVAEIEGFITDVTARTKRTDGSNLGLHEGLEYARYRLDADGRIVDWNAGARRLTGYRADEILGEHLSTFSLDDVVGDDADELLDRATSEGQVEFRTWHRHKNGAQFWATGLITALRREDGSLQGFSVTTHDITAHKRMETALRENRTKIERLHEVATRMTTCQTEQEIFDLTVDAAERILEFDICVVDIEEDGYLSSRAISSDISPDETSSFSVEEGIAGKTYRTGESYLHDDLREVEEAKPNGPYLSAISVPIGDKGVFQAAAEEIGFFTEEALELAELLVSHTDGALERLAREQELARQNERLERFTSVVSHDLRNPLNVAQGHLQLALETGDLDHLETVERAQTRMERLIHDLLTLAREGQALGETSEVDLERLAMQAWTNVETHEATIDIDDDAGTITADGKRVSELLENLFANAITHVGSDVTVRVGRLPDGFFVEDDGPGIPEDQRERVFEHGHTTSAHGTGFGLSIVKQIADAHDWESNVTDGSTGGARFEFTG